MNELLQAKVTADKEVLSVLPKNTIKNKEAYVKKIKEFIKLYTGLKNQVYDEIKSRSERLKNVVVDDDIKKIEKEVNELESKMYLYNNFKSASAKAGLDVLLYKLSCFDKLNLKDVNECILKIIECFEMVGINIDLEHFKYSIFAYLYMSVFLEEVKSGNSDKIEECFEGIYWKCPDIIIHLKLCFVYLYYKNIKTFDKYFNNLRANNNFNINDYNDKIQRYDEKINMSMGMLLPRFIKKELAIKDYQDEKIRKIFTELGVSQNSEGYADVQKLFYTLKEYKNYLDYKYLLDEVKKLYEQRAGFKDCTKNLKKEIARKEKLLFKYNKKLFKLWDKNNREKKINQFSVDLNNTIKEIDGLYLQLMDNEFKELIYNKLNDSSTILDVLLLVYSNYNYLVNVVKSNNENASDALIENVKRTLFSLLVSPYNTIINNTTFLFDGNLGTIIRDKYNLINVRINDGNLEDSAIVGFINMVDSVLIYRCIENSSLDVKDIMFILEADDILGKEIR